MLGNTVGVGDDEAVGLADGINVGTALGNAVELVEGAAVGVGDGAAVGVSLALGTLVGTNVGNAVLSFDGVSVGVSVGSMVGEKVDEVVGITLGDPVSAPAVSVELQVTVKAIRFPLLHQPPLTPKSPQPLSVGGERVHASSGSPTLQAPTGIASTVYGVFSCCRVPPSSSRASQMIASPIRLFQKL